MNIKHWHILGYIILSLCGTFLHYCYELSGYNHAVGYFSPVNESVWEHLKLVFWPAVAFSFVEYLSYGRKEPDFFFVKLISVFCSMCFVVIVFFTYSGVLGFSLLIADILLFFVATGLEQYISYRFLCMKTNGEAVENFRALVILGLVSTAFIMWTYNPPQLGIFWG